VDRQGAEKGRIEINIVIECDGMMDWIRYEHPPGRHGKHGRKRVFDADPQGAFDGGRRD
jgi:hypothetical protein